MLEVTEEEMRELRELRGQAGRAAQLEAELGTVREAAAVELRNAVLAAHPGLPERLIAGSNAAELQASVVEAEALVSSIRDATLEDVRNMAAGKAPIGFRPPARAGSGPAGPPEGVRGVDRIRWALENEGGK